MKNLARSLIFTFSLAALFGMATPAFAYGPTLSVSPQGGNNYLISVGSASAFSQITLYSRQTTTLWTTVTNFGQTDGNGYFSQVISLSSDGTNNPLQVYALIGGQQSQTAQVYPLSVSGACTYNCGYPAYPTNNLTYPYPTGGSLSLSQTSVNVNVGRTVSVTAYNYGGGNLFVFRNTNPSVVNAAVSGSRIDFYGMAYGSSAVSVCSDYFGGNCGAVYVTVGGGYDYGYNYGYGNVLGASNYAVSAGDNYFSPSSVTVPVGGSVAWTNAGGMVHSVVANDGSFNSGALYPGNTFSKVFNTPGTYYYHCNFHGGMTGSITVTGYGGGYGAVYLNPASLNLSVNQSASAAISGGYSPYIISGNSSPTVASAVVSGGSLNVKGANFGQTTMTICSSGASQCATLDVNVSGYGYGGTLSLSQTSVSLSVGQTAAITAYNYSGGNLYISSNSNPAAVSASVSGSRIDFYGLSAGAGAVTVCSNNYSSNYYAACGGIYVTVGGYSGGGSVLGAGIYPNGQLMNDGGAIYIIYKNTKTAFLNSSVFSALGYNISNVIYGFSNTLVNSNYVITNPSAAHPWGSWIQSGSSIYFAHESGFIPVPDWNIFIGNGGQTNWLVQANVYDFQRPQLAPMTLNDYRLR